MYILTLLKQPKKTEPNISPTPCIVSGSLPRKITAANNKRLPDRTDHGTRFEREKERLKEAAAALDRDAVALRERSIVTIPNPQPQISTPVPSSNHRASKMTDSQIMERLRRIYYRCLYKEVD